VDREGAEVTSAGRAFQTRAPATEKARRPTVGSLGSKGTVFQQTRGACYVNALYRTCLSAALVTTAEINV